MPLTIDVDLQDEAIRQELARLETEFSDLGDLMAAIGTEAESRVSARFETETDPAGRAWADWAASTAAAYPEDGNGRLLDRYGDMLDSLNHQTDADSARVGFGQPYAVYHEFGTETMPRRGLLFDDPEQGTLGEGDEEALMGVIETWLDGLPSA